METKSSFLNKEDFQNVPALHYTPGKLPEATILKSKILDLEI